MQSFILEHWFAVALLVVYSAILLWHARLGYRQSGNIGGFLVGGRHMGGVIIGVSFFATFASTNSYLGLAGKGYSFGAPWMLFPLMMVVATYLSWRLVAPELRRFTAMTDTVTVPEFLGARFASQSVRVITGLIIAMASLLYLIAIFKGAGNLFQVFLGIPYEAAVGLMLLVVLVYTTVGGFVSVVRTDVIQGVLMLIGSMVLFGFVTTHIGGPGRMFDLMAMPAKEHLFTWNAGAPLLVVMGIALAGSMKLLIDPRQISRFYGLRDAASVSRGIAFAIGGLLIIQFCLFPLGLYAHFLIDDIADTDLIVPTLIQDPSIFPLLVADFLVVAILSAAMSSMDSVLLVAGSVTMRDVIGVVVPVREERQTIYTRIGVISCAALAALFALNPFGDIVEITTFSGSLYAVCFVPAIMVGLHWRRGSAIAVVASFGSGILTVLLWRGVGLSSTLHEVLPALVISMGVYVVLARQTANVNTADVVAFFATKGTKQSVRAATETA
ncbi:MAG: hypothetical protein F4W90_06605 [Gammaproteobacteria bacterium]|nr:hypothetical protein [Gammaproteobacteria bacterium]